MRRPIAVLIPTLAFLLIVGSPFLRLEQGVPGAEIYPPGVESRDAYVALQTEFAPGETTPIIILADVTGLARPTSPTSRPSTPTPRRSTRSTGIDRVEGPFTIHDPATGAVADARTGRRALRPAGRPAAGRPRRPARPVRPRQHGPARRHQPAPAVAPGGDRPDPGHPGDPGRATGITTQVGGSAASGHDFLVSQAERAPYAVGLTLLASGFILFLLFGSVVIPIKAVDHDPAVDHAPASARWSGSSRRATSPTCSTSSRSGTPSRATRSSCSA